MSKLDRVQLNNNTGTTITGEVVDIALVSTDRHHKMYRVLIKTFNGLVNQEELMPVICSSLLTVRAMSDREATVLSKPLYMMEELKVGNCVLIEADYMKYKIKLPNGLHKAIGHLKARSIFEFTDGKQTNHSIIVGTVVTEPTVTKVNSRKLRGEIKILVETIKPQNACKLKILTVGKVADYISSLNIGDRVLVDGSLLAFNYEPVKISENDIEHDCFVMRTSYISKIK